MKYQPLKDETTTLLASSTFRPKPSISLPLPPPLKTRCVPPPSTLYPLTTNHHNQTTPPPYHHNVHLHPPLVLSYKPVLFHSCRITASSSSISCSDDRLETQWSEFICFHVNQGYSRRGNIGVLVTNFYVHTNFPDRCFWMFL